ncbi:hypothetical protein BC834DRAFT_821772 [Gloeopeniophorella convolvens]|nr:hypothetical protein BC834DRAFT_821772 [Gloeopeniophorella convolvens]
MASKTTILITGATGYIGGSVLQLLLAHPKRSTFEITALVRNVEKAKLLNTLGIETAIGSLSDVNKIAELAAASRVVVHTVGRCRPLEGARAILRGLKARHEKTGEVPVLIHTVRTSVLTDNAAGLHDTDVVYVDTDPDQIESIPDNAPHREVDVEVVAADKEGYVRTYIVLPSTIYGIATGKLFDLGISNPYSVQIPAAIKASVDRGQGGVVGEGKNIWPHVEIHEQAEAFQIIFDAALSNPDTPHGREGFYFGANGEYKLYDLAKAYSQVLYDLGKGKSPDPTPFTSEEAQKYFGGTWLGNNSRCRAERARTLGWNPKKTTKDFFDSIRPEVEAIIAQK